MTAADAAAFGWQLAVDGETGVAANADGREFRVGSEIPVFVMLARIAELEGKPFAEGFGGGQTVTPELVAAVSGETYAPVAAPAEPPPDPLVPASLAVNTAVAAAIATVAITSPNLTTTQKNAIKAQVQAQVQAIVDAHFDR